MYDAEVIAVRNRMQVIDEKCVLLAVFNANPTGNMLGGVVEDPPSSVIHASTEVLTVLPFSANLMRVISDLITKHKSTGEPISVSDISSAIQN